MSRLATATAIVLILIASNFLLVAGTVSFEGHSFESMPSGFGMEWKPAEKSYQAHLQFLSHNPKLCDGEGLMEGLVLPEGGLLPGMLSSLVPVATAQSTTQIASGLRLL